MTEADSTMAVDELLAAIDDELIAPVFQPIFDLRLDRILGYELLSRGPEPFTAPALLFNRARELSMLWELERACRLAALHAIAELPLSSRLSSLFFLNVSPDVLHDPRFVKGFTLSALQEHGIRRDNIVMEITERVASIDRNRFEETIRHYANQGFRIAVDDFGSGNSSLIMLIGCRPEFLKLDLEITRNVDSNRYKQKIVRSVVALAENIGANLIAEGIETPAELEAVQSLGVRYAQGFLLGEPSPAILQ